MVCHFATKWNAFYIKTESVLCQNGMRFVPKRNAFCIKTESVLAQIALYSFLDPLVRRSRTGSRRLTNRQQEAHEPAVAGPRTGSRRPETANTPFRGRP